MRLPALNQYGKRGLVLLILLLGLAEFGYGIWIPAKAWLSQVLLQQAWQDTQQTTDAHKPWPWADTWPVMQLQHEESETKLIVLASDSGQSLAFGPGHMPISGQPGEGGPIVISGHRDTHFAFLEQVKPGDEISLQDTNQRQHRYKITETDIVDSRRHHLNLAADDEQLILLTCYPFNQPVAGGPLRYLVIARRVTQPERANPIPSGA